ncbi:hypothetical protein [Enterobacter ludwigii]|uniref:hypothetical protein n=1 Tax=Enterobacter ludwigii TaxID=299767 RepID=UPI000642CC6C|nr:hypothetical protein [Enterobacter ludwigii]KLP41776.1 hypothetical protein ABR36_08005 [Enterobacter ludwigii]
MKIKVDYNPDEFLAAHEKLALITMPEAKRKRLLYRLGKRGIIQQAKRNVRNQQAPDGKEWAKRARGGKRRMLVSLPKMLTANDATSERVVVRFKYGVMAKSGLPMGVLGRIQQDGITMTQNAEQAKAWSKGSASKMCTKQQARKLRKLGYKRPNGEGGYTRANMAWMQENLSWRQAGLIIRKLDGSTSKKSWQIRVPGREFLGARAQQLKEMIAREMQAIQYGWDVKAQDIKGK